MLLYEIDGISSKDKKYTHNRIYDLRHTFISLCKDENIPEHIIQFLVGHEIGSKSLVGPTLM